MFVRAFCISIACSSFVLISQTLIGDVGAVDQAIGAWGEVVGFTSVLVGWCIVDGQTLLLELIADVGGTLSGLSGRVEVEDGALRMLTMPSA